MPASLSLQYEKQQDRSVGQTATINSAFLIGKAHTGCENTGYVKVKKVNLNGMSKLPIIHQAKHMLEKLIKFIFVKLSQVGSAIRHHIAVSAHVCLLWSL